MSTLDLVTPAREAMLTALLTWLDDGAGHCRIDVYNTDRPDLASEELADPMAAVELAKPCGAVVAGLLVLTPADPDGALIALSGDAAWGRLINAAGDVAGDGNVTDSAGSGPFKVSGTTGTALYAGARVFLGVVALG